jgi:hypothetical protein
MKTTHLERNLFQIYFITIPICLCAQDLFSLLFAFTKLDASFSNSRHIHHRDTLFRTSAAYTLVIYCMSYYMTKIC